MVLYPRIFNSYCEQTVVRIVFVHSDRFEFHCQKLFNDISVNPLATIFGMTVKFSSSFSISGTLFCTQLLYLEAAL
jgi:hypothetical protein